MSTSSNYEIVCKHIHIHKRRCVENLSCGVLRLYRMLASEVKYTHEPKTSLMMKLMMTTTTSASVRSLLSVSIFSQPSNHTICYICHLRGTLEHMRSSWINTITAVAFAVWPAALIAANAMRKESSVNLQWAGFIFVKAGQVRGRSVPSRI